MILATDLDPRAKLFFVLVISSLAVFLQNTFLLLLVFIVCLGAVAATGGSLGNMLKKFRKFFGIFIAVVLLQSIFTQQGQAILQLGDITLLTDFGLIRGMQTILRFLIIIASALVMTTSNSREIIQGLVQWKIPFEIAFMVSIAIRFLPLLREEATDMLTAIQLRGVNLKKIPLLKRIKMYSYLLLPLISSVMVKAQELSVAMEMRAFRAYPQRTSLRVLQLGRADYLVMVLCTLFFLTVMVLYLMLI
ncbi:MAG: energy-coupling factor transporter transmembrane protein EcfT [Firmicutes bacterium]|nr:energy-coupling factor transporter transmembrane protein EcfT [Bacillota bacterium]